jgi:hypothetical protein
VSGTRHLSTLFALAATLLAAQASAQTPEPSFPTRAIKIISASPAGGGVDLSARIIADQLQKLWGHPVTVENRTGGSNNIAGEAVAKHAVIELQSEPHQSLAVGDRIELRPLTRCKSNRLPEGMRNHKRNPMAIPCSPRRPTPSPPMQSCSSSSTTIRPRSSRWRSWQSPPTFWQ